MPETFRTMPAEAREFRCGQGRPCHLRSACSVATLLLVAGAALTGPALARHKEPKGNAELHTPDQVLKIMEKSSLAYEIGVDNALRPPALEDPRVLSNRLFLRQDGENLDLVALSLSKEAGEILEAGEDAYNKKDYDLALERYDKVLEMEPGFVHALTLIGDVHYARGEYEQARDFFQKAIDRNFADYDAHWFLADTLWRLGDKGQAIEQITIAHLLNVNHETLRKALLQLRDQIGRPWRDWDYAPRFSLGRDGKKVKVTAHEDWLGYAIVKAVWAYEPGYAEGMAGPDYSKNVITMEEEKEALLAVLNTPKAPQQLARIVDDGFVNEFLYYEVLARRTPATIVLLPRELFMRLVQYVNTYH